MPKKPYPPNTGQPGPTESEASGQGHSNPPPREHLRLRQALQRASEEPKTEIPQEEPTPERIALGSMKPVANLGVGLLILVMFIPGGQGLDLVPPWQKLFMPGSTTFIAAIFGLFLLSLQFRPMDEHTRARWFAIVGGLILAFGFSAANAAVAGDQFMGQPAIATLFSGGVAPVIALTLGVVPLLAALFWRTQDQQGRAPKLALGVGACLCVFMYLAGDFVGLGSQMPLVLGLDAMENAPFLGDRLAAGLAMIPLVLCSLCPLCLVDWHNTRRVQLIAALVYWVSCALPGVVLAIFVSTSTWWYWVLEPLKVILTLSVGFLLLGLGLGSMMASIDRQKKREFPT